MARPQRRQSSGLDQQLAREPWRFEFFQAVRLIERLAERGALGRRKVRGHLIGHSNRPDAEPVRFKALPSRSFPAGDVAHVDLPDEAETSAEQRAEMLVTFLGLTGPAGVLPDSYLDMLLEQWSINKDRALRDFLDLFNHRTVSLFYRAWAKHRPGIAYERAKLDAEQEDPFGRYLASLAGLGTDGLQRRLPIDDDVIRYHAGHFSHFPRTASALESMLNGLLPVPARVEQFEGQWLYVSEAEQSRLALVTDGAGQCVELGMDAMLGDRYFDVQGQFAVVLGPMRYADFESFLPDRAALATIGALVRTYAGPEFGIEIQLVLARHEVRDLPIGEADGPSPRLGWNTWLGDYRKDRDADDARFVPPG